METQANNVETLALTRERVNVRCLIFKRRQAHAPLISMHFLSSSSRVLCLSSSSSCRDLEEEKEKQNQNKHPVSGGNIISCPQAARYYEAMKQRAPL